MRMYPAIHYTMGGLWVDYDLHSTVPGLFVGGEANFSDHGANRLGASALMQGLADGYFILPVTVSNFLASQKAGVLDENHPAVTSAVGEVKQRLEKLLSIQGTRTPDSFHRELGALVWDECGMARTSEGLQKALSKIPELREQFWKDLKVLGSGEELNQSLERAGRVADFLEFGELMCRDALHRNESAGGHFREEYQTEDGEAKRNDADFSYVAAWEYTGDVASPKLHKEPLTFEYVHPSQRSYR
jgi:succinate dehydrogenase / fumarate reductase flavoprotein subunit